jgi:hypothetical protein
MQQNIEQDVRLLDRLRASMFNFGKAGSRIQ